MYHLFHAFFTFSGKKEGNPSLSVSFVICMYKFFDDDVRVNTPKTEGADSRPERPPVCRLPIT